MSSTEAVGSKPTTGDAQKQWNVEEVAASLVGGAPESGTESPVPFFHLLERLKTTKREGWRRFGIAQYVFLLPAIFVLC